ncbi:MAG: undecaprenyl-diphosphate phosphatase [Candidatus Gracilibacteria bacterium]
MTLLQAIILGIVQGITEFLPISSSGHLIIAETLLKLDTSTLKDFDIALHVGTLLAILITFRRDLFNFKWWPMLILGSVPAVLVGFLFEDSIDALFRNGISVTLIMIGVGLLFFIPQRKNSNPLTPLRTFLIGCAQAVAIIPGVSRSGATIFTAMQLGMNREEAARFSFLLGAIAIAGAGLLKALDVEAFTVGVSVLTAGFLSAFISGLLAAHFLLRFLKKHGLQVFGVYRVIVGLLFLWILF